MVYIVLKLGYIVYFYDCLQYLFPLCPWTSFKEGGRETDTQTHRHTNVLYFPKMLVRKTRKSVGAKFINNIKHYIILNNGILKSNSSRRASEGYITQYTP